MMSQIWFFPSLLSRVIQDVPTLFLVCPDFRHVRPPCLLSPLLLVHLPGWLLELMLSALISGLWYSPDHLRFSYAAITHSRGHFPGLAPTSLPWISLGPMVQAASFSSCSKMAGRSDAKEVSKVSGADPESAMPTHTPDTSSRQQQASLGPSLLVNRFFACFLSLPVQPYCFPLSKSCSGFKKKISRFIFLLPPQNLEKI